MPEEWELTLPAGMFQAYGSSCCTDFLPQSAPSVKILTLVTSGGSAVLCSWRFCFTDTCWSGSGLALFSLVLQNHGDPASVYTFDLRLSGQTVPTFNDCNKQGSTSQFPAQPKQITWRYIPPASLYVPEASPWGPTSINCGLVDADMDLLIVQPYWSGFGSQGVSCGQGGFQVVDPTKKPHIKALL